jgi:hypothetical protein
MDENLEEDRPLTEEERRENLRKMLGEDKADDYFDAAYIPPTTELSSNVRTPRELTENTSLVNWRLIGIFALIFVLVMIGAGYVTGQNVQEETVDTPTSIIPQNGPSGEQPSR